jgi:glycosyltransferase involved in cell wall biosynthesis
MSGTLLVTESTRSYGEFRRRWVRVAFERYVRRYRRRLIRAVERERARGPVTLLTARQLLGDARLPSGVSVRYYDEESYKVDSRALGDATARLVVDSWPSVDSAPELNHRGVWLPDLLTISRSIVLRMEIVEPLGILEHVFGDVGPDRVVVLSGASIPERLARLVAERRGVPCRIGAPGMVSSRVLSVALRALYPREERVRLRELTDVRREPVAVSSTSSAERVLCVTCRPRHHAVVDPLLVALRAASIEGQVVAAANPEPAFGRSLERLRASGFAAASLTNYLPSADAQVLVRRYRPVLARIWTRFERDPDLPRRLTLGGVPLFGMIRPFLRDSITRGLLSALTGQEAAFRALDSIRPTAVLITSTRRLAERALAFAAEQRGIPRVLFSGALMLGRDQYPFFDVADRMLVIGDYLKAQLVETEKIKPERISVVGDPRSNAARLVPRAQLRHVVVDRFGLDPDRPLIVFASKYVSFLFSAEEKEAYYRTVIDGLRQSDSGAQVILKVHPNENVALVREQARQWGWPDVPVTQEHDIHQLFAAADAAVMVTSMAGVEAMALGCPVIAVQMAGKDYDGGYMFPYVREGAVEHADIGDAQGFARALDRVLLDDHARAALVKRGFGFAERYIHPVDGELASRFLTVVEEIRRERMHEVAR